ncbi:hypothetical protein B0H19DRAFT_1111930 [Mycena capillaripes]|nr:hypothetical protein B0H19DRAFT_1111930 [Mycena capillaripes]
MTGHAIGERRVPSLLSIPPAACLSFLLSFFPSSVSASVPGRRLSSAPSALSPGPAPRFLCILPSCVSASAPTLLPLSPPLPPLPRGHFRSCRPSLPSLSFSLSPSLLLHSAPSSFAPSSPPFPSFLRSSSTSFAPTFLLLPSHLPLFLHLPCPSFVARLFVPVQTLTRAL